MKKLFLFIVVTAVLAFSCSKTDPIDAKGDVEIYLIKSFVESDENDYINSSTVELENTPFLNYEDLESYSSSTFKFKISDDKRSKFKLDGETIHFRAFAIVVDGEVIYTGFFWPSYSSQGMNWVVIDPVTAEMHGDLKVELGYPGMLNNQVIPDSRNDDRIINVFKRDNKLID